jgi:hypothetical protein
MLDHCAKLASIVQTDTSPQSQLYYARYLLCHASYLSKVGHLDRAEHMLEDSFKIFCSFGYAQGIGEYYTTKLANLLLRGDLKQLEPFCEEVEAFGRQHELAFVYIQAIFVSVGVFFCQRRIKKTVKAYKRYQAAINEFDPQLRAIFTLMGLVPLSVAVAMLNEPEKLHERILQLLDALQQRPRVNQLSTFTCTVPLNFPPSKPTAYE